MATNGNPGDKLTHRQHKAIAALISNPDAKRAAEAAGVGYRTLCRWTAENQDFRKALAQAEGDALGEAGRRLISLSDPAISVIVQIAADKSNPPGVRLRAAVSMLDYCLRMRELKDTEERFLEIQEVVKDAIKKLEQEAGQSK